MRRTLQKLSVRVGQAVRILGLAILGIGLFGAAEPVLAETNPEVEAALEHLANERFRKASKVCAKAQGLTGDDALTCALITSIASNQTGEPAEAAEAAQRVLDTTSDQAVRQRAFAELGVAHAKLAERRSRSWPVVVPGDGAFEHLDLAEEALRASLALGNDEGLRVRFQLANVLIAKMLFEKDWQGYDEIQEILEEYLEANPNSKHADWVDDILCRDFDLDFEPLETKPRFLPFPGAAASETAGEARVVPPRKIKTPAPEFSDLARRARIEGTVILQAVIDSDGRVRGITPLSGLPLCLTQEAMKAVAGWTFEPATVGGEPVPVFYNLSVNFSFR